MKIRLGKAKYKDEKVITKKGQFSNGGINVRRQLHDNLKKTIRNAINSYAVEQKKSSSVVKEVSNEKK